MSYTIDFDKLVQERTRDMETTWHTDNLNWIRCIIDRVEKGEEDITLVLKHLVDEIEIALQRSRAAE